jgi:glycyl-tRNA synthetase
MRWNDPALSFTRPVRWLLALLDERPQPVLCGGPGSAW